VTTAGEQQPTRKDAPGAAMPGELVVCSLEPWDEVWRRNQLLTDALLACSPSLTVLFVEPPSDPLFEVRSRRRPTWPQLRPLRADHRLHGLRPLKPLPRRVGAISDAALRSQVAWAARRLGFTAPVLWVNDVTYAPLAQSTGWPMVYDVTDDWLLAPQSTREANRLRSLDELAVANAREVVVCSQALAASRGAMRAVTLIANGVDHDHFRRPQPRPADLPAAPVAVYAGTLHDARLDIELVTRLARSIPALSVALVGPDALALSARRALDDVPNIRRIGARPYANVPAYLQHAQILIMPHRVSPFTQSLDPIKLYEYAAVGRPVVATPVAGYSGGPAFRVASGRMFVEAVRESIEKQPSPCRYDSAIPSWSDRAAEFQTVLRRAFRPPDERAMGNPGA
jgi:teichuronic acid biosynthesis glycosyltransferase TuaH